MEPFIRSSVHATPCRKVLAGVCSGGRGLGSVRTCVSRDVLTAPQTSRRYFSRYLGKSVAKDDSSVNAPATLSVDVKGSIFHYVMQYVSALVAWLISRFIRTLWFDTGQF